MLREEIEGNSQRNVQSKAEAYGFGYEARREPDLTRNEGWVRDIYWEHCGMLHVPSYKKRWDEKLVWYKSHNILLYQDGGGSRGTLIITRDESNGSIDSANIKQIIAEILEAHSNG